MDGVVKVGVDFIKKEEEFRKLNDHLEAKSEQILRNTEHIFESHEKFMQRPSHGAMVPNKISKVLNQGIPHEHKKVAEKDLRIMSQNKELGLYQSHSQERVDSSKSSKIESGKEHNVQKCDIDEDILQGTKYMSTEAQFRFVKAKAKAMQEELSKKSNDLRLKDTDLKMVQSMLKESEEGRDKSQKLNLNLENQVEKLKKEIIGLRETNTNLETQVLALKKELEFSKKNEKQKNVWNINQDIKLNKALEECNKYKGQLEQLKSEMRDMTDSDKKLINELSASNKHLEKEKNELNEIIKKQLKLIDVYKRHQVHFEATKMLFTEEELAQIFQWRKQKE